MAEWREEDHPRDELGRFTDKYGFYRANTPYEDMQDTEIYREEAKDFSFVSKREWAQWYHTISEIRRGMWCPVVSDCYMIQIGEKVFLTSGTYNHPQLEKILKFESEQVAMDFVRRMM